MKNTFRRTAIALSTAAVAFSVGATVSAPNAHADTVGPVTGQSSAASFERSVSGVNLVGGAVSTGDVITVTNKISRKLGWLIYYVKDTHPTCMEAVPNTSTWKVSGKTYTNNPDAEGTQKPGEVTAGPGWAQIKPAAGGSWEAAPLVWTQDYLVKCSSGTLNTGGLEWSSTYAFESGNSNPNVGPALTVNAGRPSISVSPTDPTVANDVRITIKHPEGNPGAPVTLTSDGKTLPGCGNLTLDGNRHATCTWVPTKSGEYPLKAEIGSDHPVTVTGRVHVADSPGGGSVDLPMDSGSVYTGSIGF
ncbi:hypothetical protein [Gordonia caeni]|uniref:Ig-like domain repeat protein n=1 Tax=Gordonia caeni TaxID=1007097 RepID=A0ABP7NNC6_9ACTN